MKNNKKITIYDVAKETNLSIATVSRVINDKGGYSEKTKDIVNKAIEKLSFIPNSTAKTLASNKSRIIGLVLFYGESGEPDNITPESYLIQFLQGVIYVTTRNKYNVLLESRPDKLFSNEKTVLPKLYDGIIFSHLLQGTLDYVRSFIDLGFPTVYAGHKIPSDPANHNIYGGYVEYKRETLDYLHKNGHRKIIVLEAYSHHRPSSNIQLLADIIETFHNENKLPYNTCQMIIYDFNMPNHLQKLIYDILNDADPPDAIFADSEASAATIYGIAAQLGLSIPDDLSIISTVHKRNIGMSFQPTLSTMYINAYEMGKHAAELLLYYIENKDKRPVQEVPFEFIERNSIKARK